MDVRELATDQIRSVRQVGKKIQDHAGRAVIVTTSTDNDFSYKDFRYEKYDASICLST